ncbi:MAG: hypothetical protein QOF12_2704 [Solirubrobacteraceae bacterium]|jgi:uncharacterized Ntn-hydrolase superfamily protein|nr:hypothetical protein [Solirubrobacteraceae bacterium]
MLRHGTYSIVAHDSSTGEVGVAVQSHWFSVGSLVPWTRPGVGAVAVQSVPDPAVGTRLLDRLEAGEAPDAALRAELDADEQAEFRQTAVVAADGRTAVHTGAMCMAYAGEAGGTGFTCQANVMASERVWGAMADTFSTSTQGPLARRMLAALHAAEAAGGDVRGRQSCAIVVAPAAGEPWRKTVDLRVEDAPEPLEEMARLLDVHDAYTLATEGDDHVAAGRTEAAGEAFRRAAELAPDNHELLFWAGLAAVQGGQTELGLKQVRRAIELQPGWAELLPRLPPLFAPAAPEVSAALGLAQR